VAVILALCNGTRTIAEVARTIGFLFDISEEQSRETIAYVLSTFPEALEPAVNGYRAEYEPKAFVIPAGNVDLVSVRLYRPIALVMRVSDDCMRSCAYCNIQKRKTSDVALLPISRITEILDECREIGIKELIISGGDPFMRPDILGIVKEAITRGLSPFLTTKSYVSAERATALAELGQRWLQVSIDTFDPATASLLTGSKQFVEQVAASIINLVNAGVEVRTNSIVTKLNIRQIPDLAERLFQSGVRFMRFTSVSVSMYMPDSVDLLPSYDDCRWLLEQLAPYEKQLDIRFNSPVPSGPQGERDYDKRSLCTAGIWGLIMHSDGKVTICDEMPLTPDMIVGDLATQTIMEVWNSERISRIRYPTRERFVGTGSLCYECADFDQCHQGFGRCFREALKAYGSVWAPAPDCPYAPPAPRLF
jgi:MoaA/NifB/PqqE/SkfB family radical SAM enzyme